MEHRITTYCTIRNHEIKVNGKLVFAKEKQLAFSEFIKAAYDATSAPYLKFFKMDALCKLAFIAAENLLKNNNISQRYGTENIALVFANTFSSLDTDIQYFDTVKDFPSPSLFVYTLPNIMLGEISIRHKFKGENAFFVFPHFTPDFLCNYATGILSENKAKAVIIGWIDLYKENYDAFLCLVEQNENGEKLRKENIERNYGIRI